MADIAISAVITAATAVYRAAQEAKANRAQCGRLAKRVEAIASAARRLELSQLAQENVRAALRQLTMCIDECGRLIDKFTGKSSGRMGVFRELLFGGSYGERFAELHRKLDECCQSVGFALQVQQTTDQSQLMEDLRRDIADMQESMMDEMRGMFTQMLDGQADLESRLRESFMQQLRQQREDATDPIAARARQLQTKDEWVDLQVTFCRIEFGPKLGSGTFGDVYRGSYNGQDVAVKVLKCDEMTDVARAEFKREVHIMRMLNSDYIVPLRGVCVERGNYCILTKFMAQGSLFHVLHRGEALPLAIRLQVAAHIAKGMQFLHTHEPQILHRDLKSLNVLLDGHFQAYLADFGMSRVKSDIKTATLRSTADADAYGTPQWMAPELLTTQPTFSDKSDVYAYGIVMWEIAARAVPFDGVLRQVLIDGVQHGERPAVPPESALCPAAYITLMQQCWAQEPLVRPDFASIVARLSAITAAAVPDGNPGTARSHAAGAAPTPPPRCTVRALHPYRAVTDEELSFGAGDEIEEFTAADADGWARGRNRSSGSIGFYPASFTESLVSRRPAIAPTAPIPESSVENLSTRARAAIAAQRHDEAVQLLQETLARDAQHAASLMTRRLLLLMVPRLVARDVDGEETETLLRRAAAVPQTKLSECEGELRSDATPVAQTVLASVLDMIQHRQLEAAALYGQAAAAGFAPAQCALGQYHEQGLGGLAKQPGEAVRLYRLSAATGYPQAQFYLGQCYENGAEGLEKDPCEAVRLYGLAAEQGNASAQYSLGECYQNGLGGLEPSDHEALRLYKLSASQGNAWGQYQLGAYYEYGLGGLAVDERAAVRLYKLSADQGYAVAQYNLGVCYANGVGGLTRNEQEAVRLYKLSAEQGVAEAQFKLSWYYENGKGGLPKDKREAARLYRLASGKT